MVGGGWCAERSRRMKGHAQDCMNGSCTELGLSVDGLPQRHAHAAVAPHARLLFGLSIGGLPLLHMHRGGARELLAGCLPGARAGGWNSVRYVPGCAVGMALSEGCPGVYQVRAALGFAVGVAGLQRQPAVGYSLCRAGPGCHGPPRGDRAHPEAGPRVHPTESGPGGLPGGPEAMVPPHLQGGLALLHSRPRLAHLRLHLRGGQGPHPPAPRLLLHPTPSCPLPSVTHCTLNPEDFEGECWEGERGGKGWHTPLFVFLSLWVRAASPCAVRLRRRPFCWHRCHQRWSGRPSLLAECTTPSMSSSPSR